eukprot:scaffold4987_cov363-Prasinococcus_capsulatus_cf.AAC.2
MGPAPRIMMVLMSVRLLVCAEPSSESRVGGSAGGSAIEALAAARVARAARVSLHALTEDRAWPRTTAALLSCATEPRSDLEHAVRRPAALWRQGVGNAARLTAALLIDAVPDIRPGESRRFARV